MYRNIYKRLHKLISENTFSYTYNAIKQDFMMFGSQQFDKHIDPNRDTIEKFKKVHSCIGLLTKV